MANKVRLAPVDGSLRNWEDYWFLLNAHRKLMTELRPAELARLPNPPHICAEEGALINYQNFRRYLLRLGVEKASYDEVFTTFAPPHDALPDQGMDLFPECLAAWSLHSRRVYNVSPELQGILLATNLDRVNWRDVVLPFDAFFLRLEQPLSHWKPNQTHRLVLVTRRDIPGTIPFIGGLSNYIFMSVADECARYRSLEHSDKARLMRQINSGNAQQRHHATRWLGANMENHSTGEYLALAVTSAFSTVSETASNAYELLQATNRVQHGNRDEWMRFWDPVLRTVAGLSMYFQGVTPRVRRQWVPPPGTPVRTTTPDARCITDIEEVCDVASVYELSAETQTLLTGTPEQRRALFERGWSLVEGHWRRPAGLGWNPLARRTVLVRPYAVRKDRRPDEGLAPGAIKGI